MGQFEQEVVCSHVICLIILTVLEYLRKILKINPGLFSLFEVLFGYFRIRGIAGLFSRVLRGHTQILVFLVLICMICHVCRSSVTVCRLCFLVDSITT